MKETPSSSFAVAQFPPGPIVIHIVFVSPLTIDEIVASGSFGSRHPVQSLISSGVSVGLPVMVGFEVGPLVGSVVGEIVIVGEVVVMSVVGEVVGAIVILIRV